MWRERYLRRFAARLTHNYPDDYDDKSRETRRSAVRDMNMEIRRQAPINRAKQREFLARTKPERDRKIAMAKEKVERQKEISESRRGISNERIREQIRRRNELLAPKIEKMQQTMRERVRINKELSRRRRLVFSQIGGR